MISFVELLKMSRLSRVAWLEGEGGREGACGEERDNDRGLSRFWVVCVEWVRQLGWSSAVLARIREESECRWKWSQKSPRADRQRGNPTIHVTTKFAKFGQRRTEAQAVLSPSCCPYAVFPAL